MKTNDILTHVKVDKFCKKIKDFIADQMPKYIFTRREGKLQYGYCTHCGKEFKTKNLKHKELANCPKCKWGCRVQQSGYSRSKMIEKAYVVYYEKSIKDPAVVIARGILAVKDYRASDYKEVSLSMVTETLYFFKPGTSVMLERNTWYDEWAYSLRKATWYLEQCEFRKNRSVHSLFGPYSNCCYMIRILCNKESISEAVAGTQFQYSTWQEYDHYDTDNVKFFALYAKYPCIEYLTKLGYKNIVEDKLYGRHTYNAINWRGKTLQDVLKVDKHELNVIRSLNIHKDLYYLRLYQISKIDDSKLSADELNDAGKLFERVYPRDLAAILKYVSLRNAFNYMKKQLELDKKDNNRHFYNNASSVLIAWKDYFADCITLEFDLQNESVLFPKNIYNAHQNTIKQIKVKEDKSLNDSIMLRANTLNKKFKYEAGELFIRAAANSKELIKEGEKLNHCVGSYAKRYATGETNILFIRKVSKPDKPYFTLELRNDNTIAQIRGKGNCNPDDDVKAFIEEFKKQKLSKKKSIKKTKLSIPA